MKVYNEDKTQELKEYDLSKGNLVPDKLITHIEYQPEIKEKGHYKIIKQYANGGKDVEYIINVKGQKEIQEQDIEEDILVYKLYTDEELNLININKEYNELKQWFDIYYAQHEQKYRRLIELEKLTDEGDNPKDELIKLYNEAEIKRKRIQDLEKELEG